MLSSCYPNQNKEFSLGVKVGNFNFSVDTRGTRNPVLVDRPRKKKSQSTLRRDKLRLNRYLEMKRIRRASATPPQSSVTEKSSSESPGSMDHDKHKAGHEELDLSHNKKLEAVFAQGWVVAVTSTGFDISTQADKFRERRCQQGPRFRS